MLLNRKIGKVGKIKETWLFSYLPTFLSELLDSEF
jgi:hypothetical protein